VLIRNGYDAFISHNRADKVLARNLAGLIGTTTFHGRPLRPWLDEQYLDPGDLGREAELTTALDRSRRLLLVLSPAALASKWVRFELDYFLNDRPIEDVISVVAAPCEIPPVLAATDPIDFTRDVGRHTLDAVVARLCPLGGPTEADAAAAVDEAWTAAVRSDPGGLYAEPTPKRDAVLAALLRHDIADPATEGVALAGFWRAGDLVRRIQGHDAAYNMQMLLGECLAVAITRNPRYRQVAQRYLDVEPADVEDPVLTFVVARASSKVAEIDPALLDLGALLRIARKLDAVEPLNNKKDSIAMLVGRIASKLRGTGPGDLLIKTLSEGGAAARVAAIGGISSGVHASSVFYLSELEALHAGGPAPEGGALHPPSRMLQALLYGIDRGHPDVELQLDNAKYELRRDFGIDDLPYSHFWLGLRNEPPADDPHHAPFMGTVAKATADTMEELALRVDASHVVCLTEPRIVDALFERAGALLILAPQDTSQTQRLTGRDVPFAALDADRMAALEDGDHLVVEPGRMRVVHASSSD
jgi:hypothetical protein